MKTITTTVYEYAELSETAQEKAREWYVQCGFDHDWWDNVFCDAKEIAALMGIDIKDIYFSGFSSQGDGACFTGRYAYKKGSGKAVTAHAPQDTELQRIAAGLQAIQRKHFYKLVASVAHTGHYSHAYSTTIDIEHADNPYVDIPDDDEKEMIQLLRGFMNWIYKQLETDHDYLTSDEAVSESIIANEYHFTADGVREG